MDRSEIMRRVKSTNTSIEITVRKLLWKKGYRYRLYAKDLPGRPDIVFRKKKKVIFVNGCFWHGHNCKHGKRRPKSNIQYWSKKIKSNLERDKRNVKKLQENGWDALIVWECQLNKIDALESNLLEFLGKKC